MKAIDLQVFSMWYEERRLFTVRSHDEYQKQHIPLAISIPLDSIETNLTSIDISHPVITVCGKGGGRSLKAAELLQA